MKLILQLLSATLFLLAFCYVALAQSSVDGIDARANATELARQLASPDALVRQRSAEALAKLAATDQRKLVEGYQLEEKNKEVRLALDWALYRMGRSEALFRIVHELDSGRHDQAVGYLSELESPEFLYPYLKKQNNPPRITAGLLQALARNGDAQTLELIKPYRESLQPFVAQAAEVASDNIEKRLAEQTTGPTGVRPRTVEKPEE